MGPTLVSSVVTAAQSYDLTTLADVKEELQIADGDTANDDWLAKTISRVSAAIAQYCNQPIVAETLQDMIYPDLDPYPAQVPGGLMPLTLSRWPIVSVTSVTVADPGQSAMLLTAGTDFLVKPQAGQLVRLDSFTNYPRIWEPAAITVIYVAGYATVPFDVESACLRLVTKAWFARGRDPLLKSETVAGIGESVYWISNGDDGSIPPEIADILDRYRVPVIR